MEREWKRIVTAAAAAIAVAARDEPDLSATLAQLGSGFGREPSQRLRVLAMCVGDKIDRVEIGLRAQQLLRQDGASRFAAAVGEVRRSSDCGLAKEVPQLLSQGGAALKTTCKRGENICSHAEHIEASKERWDAGAEALSVCDKPALRGMGRTARDMSDSPPLRTGSNCFRKTADLAIALDCHPGERLVTTDHSFDELGPALGMEVVRISNRA